jgi:hypothetical protein
MKFVSCLLAFQRLIPCLGYQPRRSLLSSRKAENGVTKPEGEVNGVVEQGEDGETKGRQLF